MGSSNARREARKRKFHDRSQQEEDEPPHTSLKASRSSPPPSQDLHDDSASTDSAVDEDVAQTDQKDTDDAAQEVSQPAAETTTDGADKSKAQRFIVFVGKSRFYLNLKHDSALLARLSRNGFLSKFHIKNFYAFAFESFFSLFPFNHCLLQPSSYSVYETLSPLSLTRKKKKRQPPLHNHPQRPDHPLRRRTTEPYPTPHGPDHGPLKGFRVCRVRRL